MLYIIDVKPLNHDADRPLDYEDVMFAVIDITVELAQHWLCKIRQVETLALQNAGVVNVSYKDSSDRLELFRPNEELERLLEEFYGNSEYVDTHPVTEEELPIIKDQLPYDAECSLSVNECVMVVTAHSIRWEINGESDTMPLFDTELEKIIKTLEEE